MEDGIVVDVIWYLGKDECWQGDDCCYVQIGVEKDLMGVGGVEVYMLLVIQFQQQFGDGYVDIY